MIDRSRPQVIFLDAVGTLFGVRGSVGQVYGNLAQQFGVTVNPAILDRTFVESFRGAPAMAFPGVSPAEVPEREYAWWWAIAAQTFQQAGAYSQFPDFEAFFTVLYDHFTTAAPWFVYPDIYETLSHWQQQNIQLGIISNFDSRLHTVLTTLHLSEYFSSVTISTEVGAAKPNTKIFETALDKHECAPNAAWHIGDSLREDYEGAKAAGLRSILLKRDATPISQTPAR
ncbi:MAG: HAD family hydrolase [Leptolyngbyaceae cyanobacterium SM1_3_5]|nr:HAD family hydrolase [Leptolyngbyaceae cyanobacterium SM1_3_5]